MPPSRPPRILARGGGGFSMEPDNLSLDGHLLALTGAPRPKVCFVPTASGDSDLYIARFLAAYRTLDCEPSVLSLFRRSIPDLRAHVLAQDATFVGGGNTLNLLALWLLHGLDAILREAWDAGVVLAGVSAGALCWFDAGITDSLRPRSAGLRPQPNVPRLRRDTPGFALRCLFFLGGAARPPFPLRRSAVASGDFRAWRAEVRT